MALTPIEIFALVGDVMALVNKAKALEESQPEGTSNLDEGLNIAEAMVPEIIAFVRKIKTAVEN